MKVNGAAGTSLHVSRAFSTSENKLALHKHQIWILKSKLCVTEQIYGRPMLLFKEYFNYREQQSVSSYQASEHFDNIIVFMNIVQLKAA